MATHTQIPDRRRYVPVRLADVPLERRLAAVPVAARSESDPVARLLLAIELTHAAWHPSDTVYFVAGLPEWMEAA